MGIWGTSGAKAAAPGLMVPTSILLQPSRESVAKSFQGCWAEAKEGPSGAAAKGESPAPTLLLGSEDQPR